MSLALVVGLQWPAALAWGLFVAYLLVLACLALAPGSRRAGAAPRRARPQRFALVIPARDEEETLRETLPAYQHLDYPRALYEIIVVADNCTDRTAALARRLGATVYERNDPARRGKGWALAWIFDHLLQTRPDIDAFAVVDADSVVSPNFLRVMAAALAAGQVVVQARNAVGNAADGWRPALASLSFALLGHLRPLGRSRLGLSAGLKGNGMCFTREALLRLPWRASSLAEDLEYSLELALHGVRARFAPGAYVASPMPLAGEDARAQAIRWEFGRLELIRRYLGRLLARGLRRGDPGCLEAALDLSIPPMTVLAGVPLLGLFADAVLWLGTGFPAAGILATYWVAVLTGEAIYVGAGLRLAGSRRHVLRGLLRAPAYLAWKAVVLLGGWLAPEHVWVRTPRGRST